MKYKVATRSRSVGRFPVFTDVYRTVGNLQARVFKPHELYAMTWVTMRTFESEFEAINYCKYVNSKFFINLCFLDITRKTFGSPLPELDYGVNSPINWNASNIDEELLNFFNFTPMEKVFILKSY